MQIKLGLRENFPQFFILFMINAFVGAMVGMERTLLPRIAENDFGMVAKTAILSFIVVFGLSKALTNYFAGRFSDSFGRKMILVTGWLVAAPVPFLFIYAQSWNWILLANVFLGISQGLTWSTTLIMKADLVGPKQRGLAVGLNEFVGYSALSLSALMSGLLANEYSHRPEPFYMGIGYVVIGLTASVFLVKETKPHVHAEICHHGHKEAQSISAKEVFLQTTFLNKNLSSITQAGFFKNFNDGMAWGILPILYALIGFDVRAIAIIAAIYPATSALLQGFTGLLSDKIGRKWLIASGMVVQAVAIGIIASSSGLWAFVIANLFLGIGTAMVYPTLIAAIGDVAHPSWRASSMGIYRLWRDSGYAGGALVSGLVADFFGIREAIWITAFLTLLSGVIVSLRVDRDI